MPFLARPDGLRLAFEHRTGAGPTLVFLPGYASDMTGGKALALDDWAAVQGRAMLRLDYAGCGASEGRFEDGTIESWRDDALLLIDAVTGGPVVLVGSSMGGWLALLLALARPARVVGLVGIAAAPDFTEWGFDAEARERLAQEGQAREGDLLYTHAMWQSGQRVRLLDAAIAIACPVRLLHGQADAVVPWHNALRLADRLGSADVQVTLVKDGDHRLSRPQDLALLCATVAALPEQLP